MQSIQGQRWSLPTCSAIISDDVVREALRPYLWREHQREPDTVIVEELGVCRGRVRIDIAVVNGLLHGYEIKSDRDSLRRLAAQITDYNRVFDMVTLVVGTRHLSQASRVVPPWWGVLTLIVDANGSQLDTVRPAQPNPQRDPRSLVELLWLGHAIALLEEHGTARGVRGKSRARVWDRICATLTVDEIGSAVRARLKERGRSESLR